MKLEILIENIEIQIGGQTIDIHYSQWLDIYNELFEENHDYRIALNEGNINFLNNYKHFKKIIMGYYLYYKLKVCSMFFN